MAKFVMECPSCGKYVEAKTGFFARKKIDCLCGYTINVKTDKLTARQCPHCGNEVVYDQSKGEKAVCPVCHGAINTLSDNSQVEEFYCGQCGIQLQANKAAKTCVCPVCDYENDVQERIAKEKIRKDGLVSIIKYEGDNETLIWKHPIEDFNIGSQLIVHESQEAIFFRDGQALDLFGAGRHTLETHKLPLMEKLYKLPSDTEKTFHSEVYYINTATQMGIKWGTDSKVRLFDPMSGLHLEIGASGEFNIRVSNSRKLLLKVVGTTNGLIQEQLLGSGKSKGYFRSMVMTQVKSYLAQAIKENNINILEIDAELLNLSNALKEKINVYLDEYGLEIPEFFVERVITPDDDKNFRDMKEQYAKQYLWIREQQILKKKAEAEAETIEAVARGAARKKLIEAQADAESYRMQAEAEAAEMRMKGYSYQDETARKVGMEAMQNGIGGSGGASALGDVASLGVGLGAMSGVINMTRDAMNPTVDTSGQLSKRMENIVTGTWDCTCGQHRITGNFCSNCGSKRPVITQANAWNCICGQQGITGNFCSNCGAKRPDNLTWNCTCGRSGITGNFCDNCGKKKGE